MEKTQANLLLAKLRQPIHINYVSKYILKESIEQTKVILNKLIEDGVVEEYVNTKDYYVVKKN
jgi:hypothetical protein